ncbi:MAG: hypothetical protein KUG69_14260 [Marinosulfonomonas sp.]|nr:hypothetical protein [Marinosulfonomonas sp.]
MSKRMRGQTIALILFTAVSGWAMKLELQAFLSAASIAHAGQSGDTATPKIGLSHWSIQMALRNCDFQLLERVSAFRTSRQRLAFAKTCASFARDTLNSIPTHGFAHFVSAAAARELGEHSQSLRNFRNSATNAPFEGWIAERRFVLAVNAEDPELMDAVQADISTLLSTQSGAELLALYYSHSVDLPARINRAFLSATRAQEQRFINLLRQKLSSG